MDSWWRQCFGLATKRNDSREHPIERAARRDLMARKRELHSASLKIARERVKTVNVARAAHKRGENIKLLAQTIVEADKQLEHNTVLIAKLELCLGRIRRMRSNRQLARSVDTAAHVMRFVNSTLRTDRDLASLADNMEREMLRYTDIQEALDTALDFATSESPLAQRADAPADAEEQSKADAEADKVLREVLGKSNSPLEPSIGVQSDQARLELIMAQIKRLPSVNTSKAAAARAKTPPYQRMADTVEIEMDEMGHQRSADSPAVTLAAASAAATAALSS